MIRDLKRLKNEQFDLLVCGGGIYGAWTAYDAALRGLKVALIDKGDWAGGTSSASSKLIHGGLRYLETFDFGLVKKSLSERQMLLKTAPHRVWPLRFNIPSYRHNRLNPLKLKAGLWLYDFLAGNLPESQQHRQHTCAEFLANFPEFSPESLSGGFSYFDAQTDDARFVVEIVDGASLSGAACVNYCEALEIIENENGIRGVLVKELQTNETFEVNAHQVADTTGRWSAQFQHRPQNYRLAKGIHLILPRILNHQALLLTASSDGRVFFVIPWYGLTLVGTTDTDYQGNLDRIEITEQDMAYLLTEVNLALPKANWTQQDIIGKFAGLRVLQESTKEHPSSVSRDWTLSVSKTGLFSSIGGKFTSARQDAATIVDAVCRRGNFGDQCQTFGKPFPWLSTTEYPELLENIINDAKQLGIDEDSATWLVKRHGERSRQILLLCKETPKLCRRIRPELPFITADLVFCAQHEMVVHLDDLLRRRLPLLILSGLTSKELQNLGELTGKFLGWSDRRITEEIAKCE